MNQLISISALPTTSPCPECEDGTQWHSRYGGNDPDVWAVRCPTCDGSGLTSPLRCDGLKCYEPATMEVRFPTDQVEHYCTDCARQVWLDAGLP